MNMLRRGEKWLFSNVSTKQTNNLPLFFKSLYAFFIRNSSISVAFLYIRMYNYELIQNTEEGSADFNMPIEVR
jgi:hypothetical protein